MDILLVKGQDVPLEHSMYKKRLRELSLQLLEEKAEMLLLFTNTY